MLNTIKEFLIKNKIIVIVILAAIVVFAGVFSYYYSKKQKTEEKYEEYIPKLSNLKKLEFQKSEALKRQELIKSMTATTSTSSLTDEQLEAIVKEMTAKPGSKSSLSAAERKEIIEEMTAK